MSYFHATPIRYHFLLRSFKEIAEKPSNDAAFQTRLALFCDNRFQRDCFLSRRMRNEVTKAL